MAVEFLSLLVLLKDVDVFSMLAHIRDFYISAGFFSDPVTLLVHRVVVPASKGISRSLYRRGLWLPSWAYQQPTGGISLHAGHARAG